MSILDINFMAIDKNKYYMFWFLGSLTYSIIMFHWVLSAASTYFSTGYIDYHVKSYIVLHGSAAIFAHVGTFFMGVLSAILTIDSYKKFSRSSKKLITRR